VPREQLETHRLSVDDLKAGRVDERFCGLMRDLVTRARALFVEGRPLCDRVRKDLRFELRLTWLGGSRILTCIERAGYDVFRRRPQHGLLDKLGLAWRAWRWQSVVP
jgi:phytoene/squalene synthetase